MAISDQRRQYTHGELDEGNVDRDPMAQFRRWLDDALHAELRDATAMTVATASADGKPSARVMLLKGVDAQGFIFYSNADSRKGRELAANPFAAVVFYWSKFDRQVRIEGRVEPISREQAEAYFHVRPRQSQVGALASRQSNVIANRAVLDDEMRRLTSQYEGVDVPVPEAWTGYRLAPQVIEFWHGRPNRLHDRLRYTRQPDNTWRIERLAP